MAAGRFGACSPLFLRRTDLACSESEFSGDTTGAIRMMKTAVSEGVEAQLPSENLAWLYY